MRTLNRNKSPFWYLLYDSNVPAKDEYGNETGEELVVYKPAGVDERQYLCGDRLRSGGAVR